MRLAIFAFALIASGYSSVRADSGWLFWIEERNYGGQENIRPFKWTFQNAYQSFEECDSVRLKIWEKESGEAKKKITEPTLGFHLKSNGETYEKYFYCLPVGFDPRGSTGR